MAELVDALVSGTSIRKYVQVRVLFWAQGMILFKTADELIHNRNGSVEIKRGLSCPGGEIGRHASLRGWCSQGRAGSSPVLGT
jgi:hypothetical protein